MSKSCIMKSNKIPPFTLRLNPNYIDKLKYIAKQNGRSTTKEIEQLVIRHIKEFEEKNYPITQEDIDRMYNSDY